MPKTCGWTDGSYKLTYRFVPPEANGFFRHID